jgi:hypothetical protein
MYFPLNLALQVPAWSWFEFLTHWSWLGLMFYFTTAILIIILELRQYSSKLLFGIYDKLFAMAITFPWFVTIVFWVLLRHVFTERSDSLGKFDIVNPHSFNLVMIIIEIILSRWIPSLYDVVYPIIALYMIFLISEYCTRSLYAFFILNLTFLGRIIFSILFSRARF